MDASDLESCVGKTEDSPEVIALLAALRVVKKLKVPKDGGGEVDVKLAPLGLVLGFRARDPKSSKLTLDVVQFCSSKEKGYKTFLGELPRGLKFSDKQDDAKKKLGKPTVSKKAFNFDKWRVGAREIGIDYDGGDGTISVVHLSVVSPPSAERITKMNASDFESCVGKPQDSPEVIALLASLKVPKEKLKVPKDGGGKVRVELRHRGLLLVFEARDLKSSQLTLEEVQFYSNKEKGFTAFSGELPGGLKFSDTQEGARKKLGKPTDSKKMFRLDRFRVGARDIGVNYAKVDGTIALIHLVVAT